MNQEAYSMNLSSGCHLKSSDGPALAMQPWGVRNQKHNQSSWHPSKPIHLRENSWNQRVTSKISRE